ncbi:MAG: M3 family metallopeptidase [Candidatus Hodarchaeales archaeon]
MIPSDIIVKSSAEKIKALNWDMTPEEIKNNTEKLVSDLNSRLTALIKIDEPRTFENTVQTFENILADLEDSRNNLEFPAYVSPDSKVRDASNQAQATLRKYKVDVLMNADLYRALKTLNENKMSCNEEEHWLYDHLLRDFKRNGLDLDTNSQEKLKKIKKEMADIRVQFSGVLNSVSDTLTFSLEELEGVPENTLKILKRDDKGGYIVDMSYPNVIPVLEYAKNPETRKTVKKVFSNRCVKEKNVERLEKTIQLRAEAVKLLGYPDHASYIHEIRMAKVPENVNNFHDDLINKLTDGAKNEIKEFIKLKNEELGPKSDGIIHHYDWRYYTRIFKEKNYRVDATEIKKYFPLDIVLPNMLNFYQDLFGLIFTPIEAKTWHEDVKTFVISDSETNELIGIFYLDLFPREGKYNHAAAFTLIKGRLLENNKYQATASAMVANFNKPTPDDPSLLPHSDVETLYHEFGHIVHQTITTARFSTFSGTKTKRDFVEAPSQLLENWMWEPSILKDISSHYQTGEPLPDEMIENMISAKNAGAALHWLRQIFYGKFDIVIHTSSSIDSQKLFNDLHNKIFLIDPIEGTNGSASFGHIISGDYDAGYYGYLWAKVYSADMYTRFQKEGILSKEVGKAFRKWILEPGGSMEEEILIEKFLGRKPNNKAFLKSIGL